MITIFHNPRCSKSREALALTEAAAVRLNESLQVVEYLKTPPDLATLTTLVSQLGLPARALLREGEAPYGELGLADSSLSDESLLKAVAAHPMLLQRPVVVRGGRAVIGRPPEQVLAILSERGSDPA